MYKTSILLSSLLLTFILFSLNSCELPPAEQEQGSQQSDSQTVDRSLFGKKNKLTVAFYNLENLFDTQDDPRTLDEDFTPTGRNKWTQPKYEQKLTNLAKVIQAIDKGKGPDILGVAECENEQVLLDLAKHPGLKRKYKVAHKESRDRRGIDVAMLYDPTAFDFKKISAHQAGFPFEKGYRSRDVVEIAGTVAGDEALHILVNHWPSRREGKEESERRRVHLAQVAKKAAQKITSDNPSAHIVMMGDFNDDPSDKSISQELAATAKIANIKPGGYYNPMGSLHKPKSQGTLTYKGRWNLFDQFIMSPNLVQGQSDLQYVKGSATIFNPQWLRVGYGKCKECPKRAIFRGKFQEDGYSDHFPVYMKLIAK